MRCCAGRVVAVPTYLPVSRTARGAASRAICVPRPAGVVRVRGRARRRIHRESAWCAVSCAVTPATACAPAAGNGIRSGPSFTASTSQRGLRNHRCGSTGSLSMSPRYFRLRARAMCLPPWASCSSTSTRIILRRCLIEPRGPAARWVRWPGRWKASSLSRAWPWPLITSRNWLRGGARAASTPSAALRPAVDSFAESLLTARARARRAGTLPRSDRTIDVALATLRDLALFLNGERGKQDWSTVDVADIEAFLDCLPGSRSRRLTVLRQFFRFARTRRLVLVDPTRGLTRKQSKGFRGRTLTIDQRLLFRRWTTDPLVHPHEALAGMLALLHGASPRELRLLRCDMIDDQKYTVRLDGRPLPVPLDPASWSVLTRCLAHRLSQRTRNPYVIVTKVTKTGREPASAAYLTHVLDECGISPRIARSTRLVDLVNTMDPKIVAVAFGMHPEGAMVYLADHVDAARLPRCSED